MDGDVWEQLNRFDSGPEQSRSVINIGPVPSPKCADEYIRAPNRAYTKNKDDYVFILTLIHNLYAVCNRKVVAGHNDDNI